MVIGAPPPFALIVEDAARVEAQIAADRAHVAVSGPRNVRSRLRENWIVSVDGGVLGNLPPTPRGAELDYLFIHPDRVQLLHAVHVDEHRRRHDAAADVHDQIGAAAKRHACWVCCPRSDDLVERLRIEHAEFWESVHQPPPFVFGDFSIALRRFSIASNTRSGVAGRLLNRIPIASAMALVSAGKNAAREPSPASLAPKGPCGSLLSIMPASIGGESWIVGTR